MLEARFLSVGPIAIGNRSTNHGHENRQYLFGPNEYSQIARERLMSGRATDRNAEIDSGLEVLVIAQNANSANAEVISVFDAPNQSPSVEGDIKFARQIVELAVVNDELPQFMTERRNIDQFVRIDSSRGIGRQVADVVRTCAARVKADALNTPEDFGGVAWLDQAQLDIGASGDLDVAGCKLLCHPSNFAELKGFQLTCGDAQSRHEGVLLRREEEEAMPFETKSIFPFGSSVSCGIFKKLRIGVKRVQLSFDPLLEDQILGKGSRFWTAAFWRRLNV